MGFRKSMSCMGKVSQAPVTEYDSLVEAQQGADHARVAYARDLEPYQCDECQFWHLAPVDRRTPSQTCSHCRGADGAPKESYQSEQDARRRAEILRLERHVILRAYQCRFGNGWHLTKR